MEKNLIDDATTRFQARFHELPKEAGYPVISIYKKQKAYLYGQSQETVQAYKKQQDILRWLIKFYLTPFLIGGILLFREIFLFIFEKKETPLLYFAGGFMVLWLTLFVVLYYKSLKASKISKKKVIWINY